MDISAERIAIAKLASKTAKRNGAESPVVGDEGESNKGESFSATSVGVKIAKVDIGFIDFAFQQFLDGVSNLHDLIERFAFDGFGKHGA